MFKLAQSPTYWWPVRFTLPAPEQAGLQVEHGFDVQFKRLNEDEHEALLKETAGALLNDRAFAKRVVSSFRHVLDDRDVEVPFSQEALDALLRTANVGSAIAKAYFASRVEAAEKNSSGLPVLGHMAAPTSTTAH